MAACVALIAVFKSWKDKRSMSARLAYVEVPPISAQVEVNVLRLGLVEMQKVMGAMKNEGSGVRMKENVIV